MPETTNDELARMIKEGFDSVDLRFDKLHNQVIEIHDYLERIERVILTDHQRRIERIEEALAIPKA